jgi:hypothetical protein
MEMPKRPYVLAIACYLAIPRVLIAGATVFSLIDPEWARHSANYTRNYRLLEMVRTGAVMAAGGFSLALWILCCYLVLRSRRRSVRWLLLAAAGPFGFVVIAALEDRVPAPGDLHQRFLQKLKIYGRIPLEIVVFVALWSVTYELVVLKRDLMILVESVTTGTPAATIIAQQAASSGMWAAGEFMEQMYLLILIYLLRPIFFNLVGYLLGGRIPAPAPR